MIEKVLKWKQIDGGTKSPDFSGKGVEFYWLGQSGFLFSYEGTLILLDAYLSNFLVDHNPGLPFSHERMIPPPLDEEVLKDVDYLLITHGHEDHMDPDLMKILVEINRKVQFVIPPGCRETLSSLGIPEDRIISIYYDKSCTVTDSFTIEAFPAAHPEPVFDPSKTWALSYQLIMGDISIFFAGDTTLYPELVDWLKTKDFDLLILPINGRDPEKEKKGVVGNMSFEEAVILSLMLDTPAMGTHFGMFAFNTIDPETVKKVIKNYCVDDRITLSEHDVVYSAQKKT